MSKGNTENRVFVNHVPAGASIEDLVSHFSQFGTTSDVYLPRVFGTNQHKGIAYVTFDYSEAKELALKCPAHVIMGQQVSAQVCLPKGAGKGPMPGTVVSGDRIFITQIAQDATQEEVQAYFAQFGDWTDVFMPRGNFSAGHKGMCFISFSNPASVTQVLRTQPHAIRGQQVVVDAAAPRTLKGGGGGKGSDMMMGAQQQVPAASPPQVPPMHHHMGVGMGMGMGMMGHHTGVVMPPPAWTWAPMPHYPYAPTPTPMMPPPTTPGAQVLPGRLFLTKMSPNITREDLTVYFQQFGGLNDVFIPSGGKAIAFVGYNDPTIANAVAHMSTHEVKQGCFVNVDMAVDRPPLGGSSKGQGKPRFQPY